MNWIPGLSDSDVRDVLVGHVVDVAEASVTVIDVMVGDVTVSNLVHLTRRDQFESLGSATPWRKTRGLISVPVYPAVGQLKSQISPTVSALRTS